MSARGWAGVLSVGLFALGGGALEAQEGRARALGPLLTQERSPLYQLFHTPIAQSADLLRRGQFRMDVANAYSNVLETHESEQHFLYLDFERLTTTVTLRYGITSSFEVGTRLGLRTDWGGFLDPVISGWHNLLGLPDGDRDKVGHGNFGGLFLRDRSEFLSLSSGLRREDVRLFMGWRLAGDVDADHSVALRGSFKLPVGDRGGAPRRWDGGAEIDARWSWATVHLHAIAGAVTLNASPAFEPFTFPWATRFMVAVEREMNEGLSLLGQVFAGSPYFSGIGAGEFDRIPFNLALGVVGGGGSGWIWQVSLTEDIVPNSPSVDFTVDIQFARLWGGSD